MGKFTVRQSDWALPGYIVWTRQGQVIGVHEPAAKSEREKLYNKFGLTRAAPACADGAVLHPDDYARLAAETPALAQHQGDSP